MESNASSNRARRLARAALGAALLAAAPAAAELCSVDQVPAATVLLPYFEVDLADPSGLTTLFELANALPAPVLARVTLWTDLAVPTYAFDVHLTGYDVQSFNLRDLFAGRPPITGDEVTPDGRFSLPAGPLPGCDGSIEPAVPATHLRAAHTGNPSPLYGGLCAGLFHGDPVARGYVTADVVGECGSDLFPSDPGYFGPGGVARYDNALWGDYIHVDPAGNFAQSDSLVRLEADPDAFGPGDRTFYGRYVGFDSSDGREPLPAAWAARSMSGAAFDARSEWVVWRETPGPPVPFLCGGSPSWYPLSLTQVVGFDEEENGTDLREGVSAPVGPYVPPAAVAAQRLVFPLLLEFGWVYADLSTSAVEPAQAYLASLIGAHGRFRVGSAATPLSPACGPRRGCDVGEEYAAGEICVHGTDGDGVLSAGEAARVEVRPSGCFDSCSFVHQAACVVRPAAAGGLEAASRFCVQPGPLAGCNRPPFCLEFRASCSTPPLTAGGHVLRAGDLALAFTVPAVLPPGGLCAGSAF